jgi:site-specific DNA-methyltransferase (adenine-specific)
MTTFRLHQGDAIELMRSLPDASIDLLLTDSAYESLEKHRSVGTTTRLKKSAASSNEWFPIFKNDRFEEFFAEAFRILKKNAHLYFFCDQETMFVAKPIGERAGFKFWKPVVWAKTKQGTTPDADDLVVEHQAMGMGYHMRASCEFVLFFEKGKRKLSNLGIRDVLPFPIVRNGYPTQKPVELNRVFVRLSSLPGEVVLDPFMGSASAGIAAVRNDRLFIGCDIKESAVELARKNLLAEGAKEDPDWMPVGEPPAPQKEPSAARKRLAAVLASGVDGTSDAAHFIAEEAAPLASVSRPVDAAATWCACAGEQTSGVCTCCGKLIRIDGRTEEEDDGLV